MSEIDDILATSSYPDDWITKGWSRGPDGKWVELGHSAGVTASGASMTQVGILLEQDNGACTVKYNTVSNNMMTGIEEGLYFQTSLLTVAIGNQFSSTVTFPFSCAGSCTYASLTGPGLNGASSATVFASLSTCNGALTGATAAINDSNTNTWGATIAGGGSDIVMAYCNGSNWTVAGK